MCAPLKNNLLTELNRQLAFRLRHLIPKFLQVILQRLIVGLFVQSKCKPAVRRGQIARRAGAA